MFPNTTGRQRETSTVLNEYIHVCVCVCVCVLILLDGSARGSWRVLLLLSAAPSLTGPLPPLLKTVKTVKTVKRVKRVKRAKGARRVKRMPRPGHVTSCEATQLNTHYHQP